VRPSDAVAALCAAVPGGSCIFSLAQYLPGALGWRDFSAPCPSAGEPQFLRMVDRIGIVKLMPTMRPADMVKQSDLKNKMLRALTAEDFGLLEPYLEPVRLTSAFRIAEPRKTLEHVYFPESGIGSVLAVAATGTATEAGMFGREGFVPTATIIGDNEVPYLIEMHVAGSGYRIPIDHMRKATLQSSTLQIPFIKYMHVFATQVSYTSLANAKFRLEQRLARWILMCHDRLRADVMEITHDYIALLLGVRRPGVTTGLHLLEGLHLIRSTRGAIEVLDRGGLEAYAAGSYGIPEEEFERLIGEAS